MEHYICLSSNQYAKRAVQQAEEIIELFLIGKKAESLRKSLSFFDNLNMYLFGKTKLNFNESKRLLSLKFKDFSDVKWNEYNLAHQRAVFFSKGERIPDCGFEHNASIIDWLLDEFGLIEKRNMCKELVTIRGNHLKSSSVAFPVERKSEFKEKAECFYRNAYRAEMYSHKVYTDTIKTGFFDMYTPLILARMGVEQYLKAYCKDRFNSEPPSEPSECRKLLKRNGIITEAFSNEINAVLRRGNVNAHESYANYPFAIIHDIEMLKECFKYFDSNTKYKK